MDANEKRILTCTSAAHCLTHFFILVFPALVMPLSRDLSLPPERVIAISFGMYLVYGILAIPWGYLSDKYEPRTIMGAGLILTGLGFAAAGQTESISRLPFCFLLVGAGCSAYHPSGLALISKGIRQRGKALGINGLFGNLGIAGAPVTAGALCYLAGWQWTLLMLGALAVGMGILIMLTPCTFERGSDRQKGTSIGGRQAAGLFAVLCGAMLFSGLLYRGYTIILPTFLENKLPLLIASAKQWGIITFAAGADPTNADTLIATIITTVVYLIGMVGQLLGGKIADRADLRWGYLVFFACALPFLLLMGVAQGPFLVITAGFFIFFSLGMQPIENSLVAMLTPPKWRGISYGIKFSIVFGAGSLSVWLVSRVQGQFGLDAIILLLTIFLALILTMAGLLLFCSRGTPVRHQ
ncbi:MAG: MFS transporter [Deltaproteobacteria bacterium]|nr:MFS transporter [Deltaproteobacteria bacterium]